MMMIIIKHYADLVILMVELKDHQNNITSHKKKSKKPSNFLIAETLWLD